MSGTVADGNLFLARVHSELMIGDRIMEILREKRLTQTEVARRAGMRLSKLNKIIKGRIKNPTFDDITAIANALEVPWLDTFNPEIQKAEAAVEPIVDEAERAFNQVIERYADRIERSGNKEAADNLRKILNPARRDPIWPGVGFAVTGIEKAIDRVNDLANSAGHAPANAPPLTMPDGLRVVDPNPNEVTKPVLAYVAAGHGGWDDATGDDSVTLPSFLFGPNDFVVQAVGESMEDEGISDGDFLIVERRPSGIATHGELVIAWLNDGLVIKRWYRRGGRKFLESANEAMGWRPREIRPDDVFEIQAVVKHIVKRAERKAKGAEKRIQDAVASAAEDRPHKLPPLR
ncbi:MAG TPA: XRE family transcriptional regulator [Thermoanaerobaculia bacterium]|nr:XRE family transcriptional regulator [Thermoanaerobaculia bacterium]